MIASPSNNTNRSILNTHDLRFQLERDKLSVTNGRTDKASYRVAVKKEISYAAAETRQDMWPPWLLLDGHEWRIPNKPDWAKKRLDCVSACIEFGGKHVT